MDVLVVAQIAQKEMLITTSYIRKYLQKTSAQVF